MPPVRPGWGPWGGVLREVWRHFQPADPPERYIATYGHLTHPMRCGTTFNQLTLGATFQPAAPPERFGATFNQLHVGATFNQLTRGATFNQLTRTRWSTRGFP